MEKFLYDPVMYAKPATYLRHSTEWNKKNVHDWLVKAVNGYNKQLPHTERTSLTHTHTLHKETYKWKIM